MCYSVYNGKQNTFYCGLDLGVRAGQTSHRRESPLRSPHHRQGRELPEDPENLPAAKLLKTITFLLMPSGKLTARNSYW